MKIPNFSKFLNKKSFTDAELCFKDGSMNVSRMILSGYSDFFAALFLDDEDKVTFTIDNIKLVDFKTFYESILLGNSFKIDDNNINNVLHFMNVLNDTDMMIDFQNWMSIEKNYIYLGIIYENTFHLNLKSLHEEAEILMSQHFGKLREIKAFDSFNVNTFTELFTRKFIEDKDQMEIIKIITRWVEYDYKQNGIYWLDLFTRVSFTNMSYQFIQDYIKETPKVYEFPRLCQFLVTINALKVHEAEEGFKNELEKVKIEQEEARDNQEVAIFNENIVLNNPVVNQPKLFARMRSRNNEIGHREILMEPSNPKIRKFFGKRGK